MRQSIERDGSGTVVLYPEEPEDLWDAYNLIRPTDTLRASAIRRVTTESSTGSTSSTRIHTNLTIRVTSLDFDPQSSQLHVSGRIVEETKWAKVGQYHTLDLELNRKFELEKADGWDSVAKAKVKETCDQVKGLEAWAVVMEEGLANLCILKPKRTVRVQEIEVRVTRKRGGLAQSEHDKSVGKFFGIVLDTFLRHADLMESKPVLLASPGYTASNFLKFVLETATRTGNKALLAQKANFLVVHSSSGHKHALDEVLNQPEVRAKLKDTEFARETRFIEDFMTLLRKDDGRAWYGPNEVEKAAERGALGRGGGVLLISDALFRAQDVAIRRRWVQLVDKVRDIEGGEVRVLSSEHESGKKLAGLGGIAAILTFPIYDLDDDEDEDSAEEEALENVTNGNVHAY